MKRTKVLVLQASSEIGGAETDLLDFLRRIPRDVVDITVLCPGPGPLVPLLQETGVPIIFFNLWPWRKPKYYIRRLQAIRRLIRLVQQMNIDVIHSNDIWSFPYAWKVKNSVPHIRIIGHVRGEVDRRKIINYHLHQADSVIPVSNVIREALLEVGVKNETIHVHYGYGDYEEKIATAAAGTRSQTQDKFVVGLIAQLSVRKGIEYFIAAITDVLLNVPNVEFQILGSGKQDYEKSLKDLAAGLGVAEVVNFMGFHEDVFPYLNKMDLLVSSSLSEGLGLTVLSALAAGKPVIATEVGGTRDLVEDGVNGFLVSPRDSRFISDRMIELLSDADLRCRMGQAGRLRYEKIYLHRNFSQELLNLYCSAASNPNHSFTKFEDRFPGAQ